MVTVLSCVTQPSVPGKLPQSHCTHIVLLHRKHVRVFITVQPFNGSAMDGHCQAIEIPMCQSMPVSTRLY